MTDTFSVSAGALSIVSLGIEVCRALVDYYQAAKSRKEDLEATISSLQSLCTTLEGLEGTLKRHQFFPDELDLVKNVELHIDACEEAIEYLDKELAAFTGRGKNPGVFENVKKASRAALYPFKKGTLLKLHETVQDVRENISLAIHTLQLDTSNKIQECVADSSAVLNLLRSEIIQHHVRAWLNAPNTFGQHYEACEKRHKDTGLWFIRSQHFRTWLDSKGSFLWLNGLPGCGKTVLASTIIQETFAFRASSSEIGLAYFYLSYADIPKQTVYGVLSSLILQLSCQSDSIALNELYTNYLAGSPPDYALAFALRTVIKKFKNIYIVIDALDESSVGPQRDALCKVINQIRQWDSLHLIITSRDYPDIREMLEVLPEHDVSLQNEDVAADIKKYIRDQLRFGLKLKKWKKFHSEIADVLSKGAGGMFRWVDCQFSALESCVTPNMLRETLHSLPETLDDTYKQMLRSIKPGLLDFARRVLTMLCFSARPIEVTEMIDALAVVVDDEIGGYDIGNLLYSADDLLMTCPGMIRIVGSVTSVYAPPSSERGEAYSEASISSRVERSDRRIVSLAHFSVKEYLVSDYVLKSSPHFHLRPSESHLWISRLSLIYLANPDIQLPKYDDLGEQLWHYGSYDFFRYAWEFWAEHARKSQISRSLLPLLRLFKSSSNMKVALLRFTSSFAATAKLSEETLGPREVLITIIKWLCFEGLPDLVDAVLEDPQKSCPPGSAHGFDIRTSAGRATTDAQSCKRLGNQHRALVSKDDIPALDKCYALCRTPCTDLAIQQGHWDVVNCLFRHGFLLETSKLSRLDPLQIAARDGQHETIRLMIQIGVDSELYRRGPRLEDPVMLAAANGQALTVAILLSWRPGGADIVGPHNVTPLMLAARRGHLDAVRALIQNGKGSVPHQAFLDRKTDYGMTALLFAAQQGSLNMVKALADAGATWKSMTDIDGNTALAHAVQNEHQHVVEWLVDNGVDTDSERRNRFGFTPKEMASHLHLQPIIDILNKASASTKPQERSGGSPIDTLSIPPGKTRPRSEGISKMPWYSRIVGGEDDTTHALSRVELRPCSSQRSFLATSYGIA
ncbi:uncharacterized protein KY384_004582 [Bacidia gigantensis]|uniref:uncharacterized protein n=1 Tax=Bacidia gigantensis TaxID=2732470 RepID=UPI001D04D80A|nr:uncharacterized protein KY384_004582 [Bacidia gigantensis]KAG8531224.1 hypothetical protein KY384_004582 [Bacidia gigantensis]